jgi:hypothetical protein
MEYNKLIKKMYLAILNLLNLQFYNSKHLRIKRLPLV